MRWLILSAAILLVIPSLSQAQQSPPATESAVTTLPATFPSTLPANLIPRDVLARLYIKELGPKYDPSQFDKVYKTHELVERYFAADSAEDRKALAKWITHIGVEPNIVGRLCRLRMDWPELDSGCYVVNEKVGPNEVHYFLGIPKGYDRTRPWPLVVKLADNGAFIGRDAPADEIVGAYQKCVENELAHHADAVVVIPLLNAHEFYGPSYKGMNSVMQAIFHAANRVNVDPTQVYMIGFSMSAHAVWNLGLHYTTYFAALAPLAGSAHDDFQRTRIMNLSNVLTVPWADAEDNIIKVNETRQLVKLLEKFKCDVDYEETKGIGHTPPEAIVERVYGKMRARTRELYPRQVALQSNRPDTIFNRLDWVQMYQELNAGPDRKYLFRIGTGSMTVSQNSGTIEAKRLGNRIEVKSDNVECMRFFVNDQMIDFDKPVIVTINGPVRVQGMLKPDVTEMLKDQLFLGRGWRYFTAFADIDFGDPAFGTTKPATRPAIIRPMTQPAE